MKKLLATAAIAALALAAGSATAGARWYLGHLGGETCVPLDDISEDFARRLYYGGGSMHDPEDFARLMSALGTPVVRSPLSRLGVVAYQGTLDAKIGFLFFDDAEKCRRVMETFPR